jgi:NADPH:quinone reductase-like Zn-dependent oxidoreductase
VFATCRAANAEFVQSLGADQVIDYRADDYVDVVLGGTGGEGVDFVFDTVGGDTVSHSIGCTKPGGRIVTVLSSSGSLDAAAHRNLTLHFVFSPRYRAKMEALRTLAERGQLKPVVDTVMPLGQVAAAHDKLEKGGVRGKIVLEV